MSNKILDNTEKLLHRAGFTTYNKTPPKGGHRPYICFKYADTNSYSGLIYTDQPENTILEIIFNECKKVGRIQIRQELNHIISITNYE